MRILHVLDHSFPETSGYALRSQSIILAQRELGWSTFHVTGPRQKSPRNSTENVGGLEFIRTSAAMPFWATRAPADFFWGLLRLRRRLRCVIAEVKPDLIHAHSPCSNGLAALGLGRPLIYEMRTLWEDGAILAGRLAEDGLAHRTARALETFLMRRADAVTTISSGLMTEIVARGVAEDRVTVVPNAVDKLRLEPFSEGERATARRQFPVPGTYVLGYVGSLFPWEGLEILLQGLARLRADSLDVGLLIVGTGPNEAALKATADDLGISNAVRFAGRVSHNMAVKSYAAIDLLVYPRLPMRLTEMVTPLKPLEAMALGKALVASDVGGHRELVTDGETGLLFRAGDPDALAAAVLRVMNDPALASRLRDNGPRHVREHRTWSRVVVGYEPVYRRLLAGRPT